MNPFINVESGKCETQLCMWLHGKESACDARDAGSIPGSGGSPGEGNGNLLQYSCLGNPTDRGAWWATVHGVARVRHDLVIKPIYLAHIPAQNAHVHTHTKEIPS